MDEYNQLIRHFRNLREVPTEEFPKKFLVVTLSDYQFVLEAHLITEISSINKMSQGPDIPTYVKGFFNFRGSRIPVFDIRTMLDFPSKQYDDSACIVVMKLEGKYVGLIVDRANEIATLDEEQFVLPAAT